MHAARSRVGGEHPTTVHYRQRERASECGWLYFRGPVREVRALRMRRLG